MKITTEVFKVWACRLTKNGRRYSNSECWSTYCLEEEVPAVLEYLKEEYYKGVNYECHIVNQYDGDFYSYNKKENGFYKIGSCKGFKKDLYIFMED